MAALDLVARMLHKESCRPFPCETEQNDLGYSRYTIPSKPFGPFSHLWFSKSESGLEGKVSVSVPVHPAEDKSKGGFARSTIFSRLTELAVKKEEVSIA